MANVVGYVTALHARDQRSPAEPVIVEVYVPGAGAGARVERWHLAGVSDNRELVMVSILRDALVHRLPVSMAVDDATNRLAAVEIHVPTRETYEEGPTTRMSGRIRWLAVDEAPMGTNERGQPDLATVELAGSPEAVHLVLERRNCATKRTQLEFLERAFRAGDSVTLAVRDYPTAPGRSVKVIVGVGLGTAPAGTPWTP